MKKITVTAIAVFVLAACVSGGTSADKTVPLDQAIQEASRNIEDKVQAGQKIAVLNFTSPTEQFSAYVIDELSIQLANGKKFVVVDRRELDLIRQEEQFQLSGEVSDESALSIGKKLGAQLVVSGSLDAMGNAYRFRIRVLNVENAVVETGSTANLSTGETKIAYMLSGTRPAPIAAQPQQPAPRPTPTPAHVTPAATPPQRPVSSDFVRVEGGTFQMGSTSGENNEKPVHTVTVKSFSMGKYEVTQKEYQEIMGTNFSYFKGDNLPVETVSWFDAVEYCNKRSELEGLTPAYTISGTGDSRTVTWNRNANGYRLPTEAEWEYAAKGGNKDPMVYEYSGSNSAGTVAWYKDNSGSSTQPVGGKAPNSLGLYDMSGNVNEWCWDRYESYSSGSQTDPSGASSGADRVFRGGWCSSSAGGVRSAVRYNFYPSGIGHIIGFRLVRN